MFDCYEESPSINIPKNTGNWISFLAFLVYRKKAIACEEPVIETSSRKFDLATNFTTFS